MSITSANAVFWLTVPSVFTIPQKMQQFATDDLFETELQELVETAMGADGILTGGFVFRPVTMGIMLMADSPSNGIMDTWAATQQAAIEAFPANGIITLTGIGRKFTLTRGFQKNYKPMPDAKKTLQPRKYEITWNTIVPSAA